jgi:ribosomal protein L7/L12
MRMRSFTKLELKEAKRAIDSTIGKCEKALPKLKINPLSKHC